ncbi:MAG: protein adenylyltransferase SelO family protein, partial [Roseovarius confluentis]
EFTNAVHAMPGQVHDTWRALFGRKIGLADATSEDEPMIVSLLDTMAASRADFTNTFRALSDGKPRDEFLDPTAFDAWEKDWRERLEQEQAPDDVMRAANPVYIPRNHRVEQMIAAAVAGDMAPFHRLCEVLAEPYRSRSNAADLARPPEPSEAVQQTFCGT